MGSKSIPFRETNAVVKAGGWLLVCPVHSEVRVSARLKDGYAGQRAEIRVANRRLSLTRYPVRHWSSQNRRFACDPVRRRNAS